MDNNHIVADLHNHSTASDGEYSPSELVSKAKEIGLQAIGLTDHDSIAGLDEAVNRGHAIDIQVIPGIELTLRFRRPYFVGSLHLLIYFSEALLQDIDFRKDLTEMVSQGRGISLVTDRVTAINREFGPDGLNPVLNKPLTVEEVTSYSDNVTRRHFFMALSEIHKITDKKETDKILGNSSPAYIPSGIEMNLLRPFFDRYSVVKVFAHPAAGSFPGDSHYKEVLPPLEVVEKLLPEFLDPEIIGIDGLEAYYPGHTEDLEKTLLGWADRHKLIVTGGSDCHDTEERPLGIKGVNKDELDKLINKIG